MTDWRSQARTTAASDLDASDRQWQITIVQGHDRAYPPADIYVIIDVIRAFTVAHVALERGARRIVMAANEASAMMYRNRFRDALLAGERRGLPIPGFDLDNSPVRMGTADVAERTVIQRTTNGVQGALRAPGMSRVYVTGFSNAAVLAAHLAATCDGALGATPASVARAGRSLVLVATHPTSDDDVACAEYIRALLQGGHHPMAQEVIQRIRASEVAAKFLDPGQPLFAAQDLDACCEQSTAPFVMQVAREDDMVVVTKVRALGARPDS
jgi:2-phosphosulfolactate phosphatase